MELADRHRWWKERGSSGVRRLLMDYLRGIREDHMGPSPSGREGDSEVARRLTAWYASEMA